MLETAEEPAMTRQRDKASQTRGQSTYNAILSAIRDGIYSPGDPLREEEVAARLGVSRTPVREALGRLQEKGLLEAAPGRGVAVAILSMQQIFELYAMRQELEAIVAKFAAQHATDAEIINLERINDNFAAASGDARLASQWNRQFHARLYDAARNRYLRQAVEGLQENIALLPETTFIQEGRTETAADEHRMIIAAIRRRDSEAAEREAVNHIRVALAVRLEIAKSEVPDGLPV